MLPQVSPTPGRRAVLYSPPLRQQFGPQQVTGLGEALRKLDSVTSVLPIVSENELQLTQQGKTVFGDLRYTAAAFKQLSQIMASGTSKFLPDLAGMATSSKVSQHAVDGGEAIRVWNRLVSLRRDVFSKYRLIRNDDSRMVEGFVGNRHKFLENWTLYQQAVEAMSSYRPNCKIYAAQLLGRQLSVWFRDRSPLFCVTEMGSPWPVYRGCYFTNGEATGTSVRGTAAFFTPCGVCLAPYRRHGFRARHTGKNFFAKLGQLFVTVCDSEIDRDTLYAGVLQMLQTPLGFAVEDTERQRRQKKKELASVLLNLGLGLHLSRDIIAASLAEGMAIRGTAAEVHTLGVLYASRTSGDVFAQLLCAARQVDIDRREQLEQIAFDILNGNLVTSK